MIAEIRHITATAGNGKSLTALSILRGMETRVVLHNAQTIFAVKYEVEVDRAGSTDNESSEDKGRQHFVRVAERSCLNYHDCELIHFVDSAHKDSGYQRTAP